MRGESDSGWLAKCIRHALVWLLTLPFCASVVAGDAPDNYQLASGDAIRVAVFQNPDLTLETRVSEDGSINYPLIGSVAIGGLGISAAEARIAKRLRDGGFLKLPQVNISLLTIRGNKVSVLGQVNRPGSYALETTNTRISQMLAEAGGLAAGGADQVVLTGTRNGIAIRKIVDVDAIYRAEQADQDVPVLAGDTVYVPRAPMFYIYGEITRPGNYRIDRNMTMRQALAAGGGLTARGTERRLRVVRRNAQGVPEKISVELNDPVQADDVVYVNESFF